MNVYCVSWDASQATIMANSLKDLPYLLNQQIRENRFYTDERGLLYFKWSNDDYSTCEVELALETPQVLQIVQH